MCTQRVYGAMQCRTVVAPHACVRVHVFGCVCDAHIAAMSLPPICILKVGKNSISCSCCACMARIRSHAPHHTVIDVVASIPIPDPIRSCVCVCGRHVRVRISSRRCFLQCPCPRTTFSWMLRPQQRRQRQQKPQQQQSPPSQQRLSWWTTIARAAVTMVLFLSCALVLGTLAVAAAVWTVRTCALLSCAFLGLCTILLPAVVVHLCILQPPLPVL